MYTIGIYLVYFVYGIQYEYTIGISVLQFHCRVNKVKYQKEAFINDTTLIFRHKTFL